MPNIQVKLRRGTTSQHTGFTGAEGEVTVDTDKDTVIVHDGSTAGGHELAKASDAYSHPNHTGDVTSTGDGATVIADDAVTPAKLDDTQAYTVSGLTSDGANILINNTAASGAGIRFDKTNNASPDGQIDLFVDSNGALQITAPEKTSSQTLATLANDGTLTITGEEPSGYTDSNLQNISATGLGGRMRIIQGSNVASVQYQESGERVSLNIVDGSLSANAGITIACSSASQASLQPSGSMYSNPNSNVDLGSSANTWDNGYINGGAWTGSDRNLKQDIDNLSEAELRVATALKGLMKKFRLKDAVAKKGDDARIHVGVIAQDVKAAFEAEGLDAYRYAIIGEDTWWSKQDENGEWIIKNDNPNDATYTEYTKMSVRYEQLLAFIIAAM